MAVRGPGSAVRLDDLLRRTPGGDRLGADLGGAATLLDQRFGLFRRRAGPALTRQRGADIGNNDLRTGTRHHHGDLGGWSGGDCDAERMTADGTLNATSFADTAPCLYRAWRLS